MWFMIAFILVISSDSFDTRDAVHREPVSYGLASSLPFQLHRQLSHQNSVGELAIVVGCRQNSANTNL